MRGGVDSIEHGYLLSEGNAAQMARHGVWLVPTLSITHNVRRMRMMSWSTGMIEKAQKLAPTHRRSVERARDAGVRLAAGSDMRPVGPPGVEELVLLSKVCLSPWEALKVGTIESATLCGLASGYGTLDVGKWANCIVIEDNPLEGLSPLLNPYAVLDGGVRVSG